MLWASVFRLEFVMLLADGRFCQLTSGQRVDGGKELFRP